MGRGLVVHAMKRCDDAMLHLVEELHMQPYS